MLEQRLNSGSLTVTALVDEYDAMPNAMPPDYVGNDGTLSLREAILEANALGGGTITFAVAGTINVGATGRSSLPRITVPVTIDGGGVIELNGSSAGAGAVGLSFAANGNTIEGLTINRFSGDGIYLASADNVVQGNLIGIDPTGKVALGNGTGILVAGTNNLIGGTTSDARNLISGNNNQSGVTMSGTNSTNNLVQGNFLGTDITGTSALHNYHDILIAQGASRNTLGGTTPGAGNLVSGSTAIGSAGILIDGGGTSGNVVQGNLVGTDAAGTKALDNIAGIVIQRGARNNLIGGTAPGARNIVSGNDPSPTGGLGIGISADPGTSQNVVQGNYVGVDITGETPLANGTRISVSSSNNTVGGTSSGASNIVSGNTMVGIGLGGVGNVAQGNYVGTDGSGMVAIGNGGSGVSLYGATGCTVGGTTPEARNIISGNAADGIIIQGNASNNLVQGNFIGTDGGGMAPLGNSGAGVNLYFTYTNTIGGTTPAARNIISGNRRDGVAMSGGASNNSVQGNFIGTDVTGTKALGNQGIGVILLIKSDNTIGGTASGARNVISGNAGTGVQIQQETSGDLVQGNFIGTDASGLNALGNGGNGVALILGARDDTVGGVTAAARNVISGNLQDGVFITDSGTNGNLVQGNLIGTSAAGTGQLSNGAYGVHIAGAATTNVIGGTAMGAVNLISGNAKDGVAISGQETTNNQVQGNRIGTDGSGTTALANSGAGVSISGTAANNTIGGTIAEARNLISGNLQDGFFITDSGTSDNLIQGNFIDTNTAGTDKLGNGGNGVHIVGASNNMIGGDDAAAGNVIAFNGDDGVLVDTGTGNAIRSNAIFSSGKLGIKLANHGNQKQAAPELTAAVGYSVGGNLTIRGTLSGAANAIFTFDFFANAKANRKGVSEGEQLLGSASVATDGAGRAVFSATLPAPTSGRWFVSATATDPTGNTSAFAGDVAISGFAGIDASCDDCGDPPDTIGAAGPSSYIETVNTSIAIYNKNSGERIVPITPFSSFFSPLGNTLAFGDPVVVYDELIGRYAIGVLDYPANSRGKPTGSARFDFALSKSSNPTTLTEDDWTIARYSTADHVGRHFDFADYPKIGYNADGFVVSFNVYRDGDRCRFRHVAVLPIRNDLSSPGIKVVRTSNVNFTLAPAAMHTSATGDPMWFVEDGNGGEGGATVTVVKMALPFGGSAKFQSYQIAVNLYLNVFSDPRQPRGSLGGGLDTRFYFAGLRTVNGVTHLVSAHTVGTSTGDQARWYDFRINGGAPVLLQEGAIDQGAGVDTYLPDADIAPDGSIGLTFAQSSSKQPSGYMSMYVTGRLATDENGKMRAPLLVRQGTKELHPIPNYEKRIGDYSFTCIDPTNGTFWSANEYAAPGGAPNWFTWIQNFRVTADGVQPVFSGSGPGGAPLTAPQDQGSQDVTWIRFLGSPVPGARSTPVVDGGPGNSKPAGADLAAALLAVDPPAVRAPASGPVPAAGATLGQDNSSFNRSVDDALPARLASTDQLALPAVPAAFALVPPVDAPWQDGTDLLFAALARGDELLHLPGLRSSDVGYPSFQEK